MRREDERGEGRLICDSQPPSFLDAVSDDPPTPTVCECDDGGVDSGGGEREVGGGLPTVRLVDRYGVVFECERCGRVEECGYE